MERSYSGMCAPIAMMAALKAVFGPDNTILPAQGHDTAQTCNTSALSQVAYWLLAHRAACGHTKHWSLLLSPTTLLQI